MLKQQQYIAHTARDASLDQLLLQVKRLVIPDAAEIEVLDHGYVDCRQLTGMNRNARKLESLAGGKDHAAV
jgi:hypothetical protein